MMTDAIHSGTLLAVIRGGNVFFPAYDANGKLKKEGTDDAEARKNMKCCLQKAGFSGADSDNMINRMRGSGANIHVKCTDCLKGGTCGFVCNKNSSLPSDQCKASGTVSDTIYMCNGQLGSSG